MQFHSAIDTLAKANPHFTIPTIRRALETFFLRVTRGDLNQPGMAKEALQEIRWTYAREAARELDQTIVSRGLFMKTLIKPKKRKAEKFFKIRRLHDFEDAGMEVAKKFPGAATPAALLGFIDVQKREPSETDRTTGTNQKLHTVPADPRGHGQDGGDDQTRGRSVTRPRKEGAAGFGKEVDYDTFKDLIYQVSAEREGKLKWMRPYRINPYQMVLDLILTMETGKRATWPATCRSRSLDAVRDDAVLSKAPPRFLSGASRSGCLVAVGTAASTQD